MLKGILGLTNRLQSQNEVKIKDSVRKIRGMDVITPLESPFWQRVEKDLVSTAESYGFKEIRFPILEEIELFRHSIGDESDIMRKELYSFTDKNNRIVALRPEGTVGCLRSFCEEGLDSSPGCNKLWYLGPFFRRERPQKMRRRQFHQFGLEIFGDDSPFSEAELLLLGQEALKKIGLKDVLVEINTLGSPSSQKHYRNLLQEHISKNRTQLTPEEEEKLLRDPLRSLDDESPSIRAVLADGPKISDSLNDHEKEHFHHLVESLEQLDVNYRVNERMARGLDYYNGLVFEWKKNQTELSIGGGGRYDNLYQAVTAPESRIRTRTGTIQALGCGFGIERIVAAVATQHSDTRLSSRSDVAFIATLGLEKKALLSCKLIREKVPEIRLHTIFPPGNLSKLLNRANKLNVKYVIILQANEIRQGQFILRNMEGETRQANLDLADLVRVLADFNH